MKYTVIIAYPDLEYQSGPETWCGHVEADSAAKAVTIAQAECAAENSIENSDDLFPISVFAGEHTDLISEWHKMILLEAASVPETKMKQL